MEIVYASAAEAGTHAAEFGDCAEAVGNVCRFVKASSAFMPFPCRKLLAAASRQTRTPTPSRKHHQL